jgi:hypothetical protein
MAPCVAAYADSLSLPPPLRLRPTYRKVRALHANNRALCTVHTRVPQRHRAAQLARSRGASVFTPQLAYYPTPAPTPTPDPDPDPDP